MTLENKVQSRRGFLKTALASAVGLYTSSAYAGEKDKPQYLNPNPLPEPCKYEFKDFQKNYEKHTGSKLEGKRLTETKERWEDSYDDYTKNMLVEVLADPKTYIKKKLREEQRKEFEADLKDYKEAISVDGKEFVDTLKKCCETSLPFVTDFGKLSLAEQLILFLN